MLVVNMMMMVMMTMTVMMMIVMIYASVVAILIQSLQLDVPSLLIWKPVWLTCTGTPGTYGVL